MKKRECLDKDIHAFCLSRVIYYLQAKSQHSSLRQPVSQHSALQFVVSQHAVVQHTVVQHVVVHATFPACADVDCVAASMIPPASKAESKSLRMSVSPKKNVKKIMKHRAHGCFRKVFNQNETVFRPIHTPLLI